MSCGKKNSDTGTDNISGTYAREYSMRVTNPETGAEIGMRTIRDTIFIQPIDQKFEVSNRKWKLNDYDKDGWKNMDHDEDRPNPTALMTFDAKTATFTNDQFIAANTLSLDITTHFLYPGNNHSISFKKVSAD